MQLDPLARYGCPDDLVFAYAYGAVVVSTDAVEDVLRLCEERLNWENVTERALDQGIPPSEVYARYGAF